MPISVLRLEVTQRAIPRGITSQARCYLSTHFSSSTKKALENPTATLCLSTCSFTTWHPFPEEGVTFTIQNWPGFTCSLKSSTAILKIWLQEASAWVNSTSFPTKLPLHFKLRLLVEQTDTKDSKCLKLQLQSSQGYCVWLNKGKYLTSWHP